MLAFAMHLLHTTSTQEVRIHPDGEHGKRFDFAGRLGKRGFERTSRSGRTEYGGSYTWSDGRRIVVNPTPGKGDVVAEIDGVVLSAECKGGIINTRHCCVSRSSSFRGFEAGIFGFPSCSAMRVSVRVDDNVGIERRFKGFSSNEDAGARFVRGIVRRVARALAACQTNRMRHTPDHVRSDLPRNLGQRAVSGAQPSGPPSTVPQR
jgi:hypothetical protein